jgi:hypothetical protein
MNSSERAFELDLLIKQKNESLANLTKSRNITLFLGIAYSTLNLVINLILIKIYDNNANVVAPSIVLALCFLLFAAKLFFSAKTKCDEADKNLFAFLKTHCPTATINVI